MYLGIYDIDGDPRELLAAYDRVMAGMPESQISFHACAVRENGITIFDACPTKEAFEKFSTSAEFRLAEQDRGPATSRSARSRRCHVHLVESTHIASEARTALCTTVRV